MLLNWHLFLISNETHLPAPKLLFDTQRTGADDKAFNLQTTTEKKTLSAFAEIISARG